jgi:hypothetical protein
MFSQYFNIFHIYFLPALLSQASQRTQCSQQATAVLGTVEQKKKSQEKPKSYFLQFLLFLFEKVLK